MTARVRTDQDIARVLDKVATLTQHLTTAPHTGTHLRVAIEARRDDGLRAASYDETTHGGGDRLTPQERAVIHRDSDQASEDLQTYLHALELFAQAEETIYHLLHRRYPLAPPPRPKTGDGPCPAGLCADHWEAGIRREIARKRYSRWCRRCGDHRQTHGTSIPPLVLAAARDAGRRSGSRTDDWQHWTVARAWASVA